MAVTSTLPVKEPTFPINGSINSKESCQESLVRKPLRIFTSVWGDKYLDWFEKFTIKSLAWPKNKEALWDAKWVFLTKAEHKERLEKSLADSGINIRGIDYMILG